MTLGLIFALIFSSILLIALDRLYKQHKALSERVRQERKLLEQAGVERVIEVDLNPPQPQPQKELHPHVKEAFAEYVKKCLTAAGPGAQFKLYDLLVEFARWHGPKNLDNGILRPDPPPPNIEA